MENVNLICHVRECIRDYYSPPTGADADLRKKIESFEKAKQEFMTAMQDQIDAARKITIDSVFPKIHIDEIEKARGRV